MKTKQNTTRKLALAGILTAVAVLWAGLPLLQAHQPDLCGGSAGHRRAGRPGRLPHRQAADGAGTGRVHRVYAALLHFHGSRQRAGLCATEDLGEEPCAPRAGSVSR